MAVKFQNTRVEKVVKETPNTISIYFANEGENASATYKPGQYLTLRVEIDGKKHNRAYSLCTSPIVDSHKAVTVKRLEGGLVSNWLNDHITKDSQIEILPPMGNFVANVEANQSKHYVLIGAGSGITPLMSILKTVLAEDPSSKITLLYGNRNEESIIFKKELDELCKSHPNSLKTIHSLSRPSGAWDGLCGRLQHESILNILMEELPKQDLPSEFYICGPSEMMAEAAQALRIMHIPEDRIFQEHFSAPIVLDGEEPKPTTIVSSGDVSEVKVIIDGETKIITVTPDISILEAALDNDMDPPYACMIGSCCTCKAKLVSGKVEMDDREGLTDDEINEGFILTCQSHPITPGVVVDYDQV